MTYAEILTLINTNLASGTNITAAEHRAVEIALLNYSQAKSNYVGYITGFNVGASGSFTVGGGLVSAVGDGLSTLCTIANPMPSTNYMVKIYIESLGDANKDFGIFTPSFKKVNTTQFYLVLGEPGPYDQNLRIHFEVVSLD